MHVFCCSRCYSLRRETSGVARNLKREGRAIISIFFQAYFFFSRTNLTMIEKQERLSGGPGVCSPETILKIYMLYNGYFSAF